MCAPFHQTAGPLALNGFILVFHPGLQPGLGKLKALRAEDH